MGCFMNIRGNMIGNSFSIKSVFPDKEIVEYLMVRIVGADKRGISLMLGKSQVGIFLIEGLSGYECNVLKQECLSIGADFGIRRDAMFDKEKRQVGLLIIDEKKIQRLAEKLKKQAFKRLNEIGENLLLRNIEKNIWICRGREIALDSPVIMGIVNITPDSFSGDGIMDRKAIISKIDEMVRSGAKVIDIGAESSRPGAAAISYEDEIKRLDGILDMIREKFPDIFISLDTYKPEVVRWAIEKGVDIINDITGFKNKDMIELAKQYGLGMVVMHMHKHPSVMQKEPIQEDVVGQVYDFLKKQKDILLKEGIDERQIVIDPGIGFGKRWEDNYTLIKYIPVFKTIAPVLIGASRKSLIGYLTGADVKERLPGTISINLNAYLRGASVFRVHDVKEHIQAFRVWQKIEE